MSKIGYARCSSADQNPARQKEILEKAGCEKIFLDMLSGKNMDRPELQAMLKYIREGDTVYVESISRLARTTKDLLELVDQFAEMNVNFISQKENIDTSSPQGRFVLTLFGAMAELEREQIKQRQAEGIAIAKSQGKYKGKPSVKYDKVQYEKLLEKWNKGEITKNYMCKQLGISRSTLYRIMRETEN